MAYSHNYKVTLYSGGVAVRAFNTVGKVQTESDTDGYYFTEQSTGKLVEISGDVVIEQQ